ncbi:transporter [Spirochaetia bacterium]|nr:transporter [Spirochaetia bacterium]
MPSSTPQSTPLAPSPSGRSYRYLDLVMAAFVAILIVSNVASSAKIVDMGFSLPVFNIPLVFDGGTLLFPLSYVFGDIMTEVYGFRASRRVILTGFVALTLSAVVFFVLRILPGEAEWEGYAGGAAYDAILGGMSSGGIVLASLAGYWVGEFSNSMVLSRMKVLMKGRLLWVRTIGSTLVGEFLDSFIFFLVGCATGVFPRELFWSLIATNCFLKCAIEGALTPVTYRIVHLLKKRENVDVYDVGVRYSPFMQ